MRPQGTRCWRKNRRDAMRGVPTGRRATHTAETTYGRHQKERDRAAEFSAWRERIRGAGNDTATREDS